MYESVLYTLAARGGGTQMLIMFGGVLVIMYFLMLRPQQKERKEHQVMLQALKKGDKVVTVGGINGLVTNVKERTVMVKVADNLKLEIQRSGIAQVIINKDEIKDENPAR